MASVAKRIMRRVAAHGKGRWVCTPKDFLDLGSRAAVDAALSRLVRAGKLRRVGRGLYDRPVYSRLLKEIAAVNVYSVVDAVVRRDGLRILPSGIEAANGLGLTNAVPAKIEYERTVLRGWSRPADLKSASSMRDRGARSGRERPSESWRRLCDGWDPTRERTRGSREA